MLTQRNENVQCILPNYSLFSTKIDQLFTRMGARMLHPSSGRLNFNVVTEKTNDTNNNCQSSTAINQDQNPSQTEYKIEIETKTKDAIKNAIKSQSPTL